MTNQYDDIINLPHHVSTTRPQMSREIRAAQFAPFAALTGYEDAVNETARLTDERIELDENRKAELDERFQILQQVLSDNHRDGEKTNPEIIVTYFLKDAHKEGGSYERIRGVISKIDTFTQRMLMDDGTIIPIPDIYDIDGALF